MSNLSKLHNIGKSLEKRLTAVGIKDSEALLKTGCREAFLRLRLIEGDTCFNTLCAIDGAIKGIRWHNLSNEEKKELRKFFDSVK